MLAYMLEIEVLVVLAEKDREAKSALRVSEARAGTRGVRAAIADGLARVGLPRARRTESAH